MSFFETVLAVLKQDERFFTADGELLRNAVYESAMKMDSNLLKLLYQNETTRARFFTDVDGISVFDKVGFGWVINNREFLPDSYTRYKNKIGLTNGNGDYISTSNDVELVFPYKDCVLEGGQTREDQKRSEIFYNEMLAPDEVNRLLYPKVLTNAKRYTADGIAAVDSITDTDNFIIKGNNLLVLASLLKTFEGKIRCIYIDPPFNTGSDSFNYNDKFTRSTWLTFMKNRLSLARRLLTNDGNIFIHIDINQSHYLKVLADEVFGEENFVEEIIWAYGSPSGGRAATPKPVNIHDYILHYSKNYSSRKQNRVYVPYSEKYIKDWFKYSDEDGRLYQRRQRGKDENGSAIWVKQYLDESKGVPLSTVWSDIQQVYADPRAYKEGNTADVEVIKEFSGGQKPEALIKRIFEMTTDDGDIVLDFHLGTGTSIATAHKMGLRYIGVEQLDSQITIILERMTKVIGGETAGISKTLNWQGGGSFVYCELAKLNQKYIDDIQMATTDSDIVTIWNEILQTGFISCKINPSEIDMTSNEFFDLSLDDKKRFLMELLDKNQLYVNYCDMEDETFAVPEEDKAFTNSFYGEM
ncbi:MAG: site-specific DNA-methyltransferase [Clostridia bacterium]|nr:site-specific DNA-methyltransferase [Clostridia bacterium]